MKNKNSQRQLLFAIFIINFLSLVFQVVWVREIMVIFGTTALSISTILSVFLSGIAFGAYFGGHIIKRVELKYRFCGYSLVVLGTYCLLSIYLFAVIHAPYLYIAEGLATGAADNLLKFFLCFLVLFVPTTIIGAMFPIVTQLYSKDLKGLGRDVASIYSLDTLGAALGALLCGFFLIPVAGLKLTSLLSGIILIIIGLFIATKEQQPETYLPPVDSVKIKATGFHYLILFSLFFTGLSALMLEVVWSRYFNVILGTSIYAFSIVISAFLLGLSIGSFLIRRFLPKIKNTALVFAVMNIIIAIFSVLVVQSSETFELFYYRIFHSTNNFYLFQTLIFAITFVLLLIPTSLMGANFPLAIKLFTRSNEARGEEAGHLFSFNTAGGIVGAFSAGFILIPLLGLHGTSLLAGFIYAGVGTLFLFIALKGSGIRRRIIAASIAPLFLLTVSLGYGEPAQYVSVYYNGVRFSSIEDYRHAKKSIKVIYNKQGLYGLVSVYVDPMLNALVLLNNGKVDASTTVIDMQTQQLLAHLPLFFKKDTKNVLNIGFGSGITTGAVASHPYIERIDSVEIDPLVVEAANTYFAPYNHINVNDKRLRVINDDGRHFLEASKVSYDVIISEPPNIWVSGVSQLFTSEFYEIASERLSKGGILTQWLPAFELDKGDIDLVLSTMRNSFKYLSYWKVNSDSIILASNEPLIPDHEHINQLMKNNSVTTEVRRGLPYASSSYIYSLLSRPQGNVDPTTPAITTSHTNTDDLPFLEFKTARNIFNRAHHKNKP